MKPLFEKLRRLWKCDTFSPEAFVARAVVISALYAVSRGLGLHEYTSFLSGTSASVNLSWPTAAVLGLIHLLLHVGFILLVPIFLIAAGLLAAWKRWKPGRGIRDGEPVANAEPGLKPRA